MFSIREVAEALHVSYSAVRTLTRNRELGTVRVGRRYMIPVRELERYLTKHYVAAAEAEQSAGEVVNLLEHRAAP
jgi:excisionase family DNA binding protein